MTTKQPTAATTKLEPPDGLVREDQRDWWLQERMKRVQASDASALYGLGYRTALQVWTSKKVLVETQPTEAMQLGHTFEPTIAGIYGERTGIVVHDPGDFTIFVNPKVPSIGATIDRQAWVEEEERPGIVEMKMVGPWMASDWDDGVSPGYVQIQAQGGLIACPEAEFCDVVALIGGNRVLIHRVEPNEAFQQDLIERAMDFMELVEKDIRPQERDPKDLLSALKLLFPKHTPGKTVEVEGDKWAALDRRRIEAKEQLKHWETVVEEAEAEIRATIGDAEKLVIPGGVTYSLKAVNYKESVRKAYTTRRLTRKEG